MCGWVSRGYSNRKDVARDEGKDTSRETSRSVTFGHDQSV